LIVSLDTLNHNIRIFKYFACILVSSGYNARLAVMYTALVHRFLTSQRPELKSFRLKITQTRLALPVSDDVFAPVEYQITPTEFLLCG